MGKATYPIFIQLLCLLVLTWTISVASAGMCRCVPTPTDGRPRFYDVLVDDQLSPLTNTRRSLPGYESASVSSTKVSEAERGQFPTAQEGRSTLLTSDPRQDLLTNASHAMLLCSWT